MKPGYNSESNKGTVILAEENNSVSSYSTKPIHILFANNTHCNYSIATLSCINPFYFSGLVNNKDITITLPPKITKEVFLEYLYLIKNGISELEDKTPIDSEKIMLYLILSDFFHNDELPIQMIQNIIFDNITSDNALLFLEHAYYKLTKGVNGNSDIDNKDEEEDCWFNLFFQCIEQAGQNPFTLIYNKDVINKLHVKVIYELFQKCSSHLLFNDYICNDSDDSFAYNPNEVNSDNEDSRINYFDTGRNTCEMNKSSINNSHCNNNNNNQTVHYITNAQLEILIQYLYKVYNIEDDDLFELLIKKYSYIYNSESIKELENAFPTFQIHIPYDFNNYFYEEIPIDIMLNNVKIFIVLYYQPNDDSFNVSIKLGEKRNSQSQSIKANNYFQIISILSVVKLNKDSSFPNSLQTNFKHCANNKSMYNIFTFPNFKLTFKQKSSNINNRNIKNSFYPQLKKFSISNDGIIIRRLLNPIEEAYDSCSSNKSIGDFFSIRIYLKMCFGYSVLASYLMHNFHHLAHKPTIYKISKQLLVLVIKSRHVCIKSEDTVITALINWLDDYINIKEDITDLIDVIHWEHVREDLLFEFVIKYCHMINKDDYENKIVKAVETETKAKKEDEDDKYIKKILMSIYDASRKINYCKLYSHHDYHNTIMFFNSNQVNLNISARNSINNDVINNQRRQSNGATLKNIIESNREKDQQSKPIYKKNQQNSQIMKNIIPIKKNKELNKIPMSIVKPDKNKNVSSIKIIPKSSSAHKIAPLNLMCQSVKSNNRRSNSQNFTNKISSSTNSKLLSKSTQNQCRNNFVFNNKSAIVYPLTKKDGINKTEKKKSQKVIKYNVTNVFMNSKPFYYKSKEM